jgi:predicted transcriptional regulator
MGEKVKKDVENLFLQEKPAKILILLKKENKPLYTAIISREINGTYAHTLNVLAELERLKLVSFKETGRIKLVRLTELGVEVAQAIQNFTDLVSLAEAEAKVDQLYEREVRGRLREEVAKQRVSKELGRYKRNLEALTEKPSNVVLFAKKLIKKIDGIVAEVMGYPPASG